MLKPDPGCDASIRELFSVLRRDNAPKQLVNGRVDLGRFSNRFPTQRPAQPTRSLDFKPCACDIQAVTGDTVVRTLQLLPEEALLSEKQIAAIKPRLRHRESNRSQLFPPAKAVSVGGMWHRMRHRMRHPNRSFPVTGVST
jgi:hypothetical protein